MKGGGIYRSLNEAAGKYATLVFKLMKWIEVSIPEGFTVCSFRKGHQRRLRNANGQVRLCQEIKWRARKAYVPE